MKLITTVLDDPTIFPHFLRHYRKLGVAEIIVGLRKGVAWTFWDEPDVQTIKVFDAYTSEGDSEWTNIAARHFVEPGAPYMLADVDEFYDAPAAELVRLLRDHDYVTSRMIDRTTADGSLPPLLDSFPIEEQFPHRCRLTAGLCGAETRKVVALKAGMKVLSGHHHVNDAERHREVEHGTLHHYKWHRNVLLRMLDRYELHVRLNKPWKDEPRKVLEAWIKHGRLPVEQYPLSM